MNDRLQENLREARSRLLEAREWLYNLRRAGCEITPTHHRMFFLRLDRAWDAQCMANPGLQ